MYYYGGYQGYGNQCCGNYQPNYGYGNNGYGAAIILVLFILYIDFNPLLLELLESR